MARRPAATWWRSKEAVVVTQVTFSMAGMSFGKKTKNRFSIWRKSVGVKNISDVRDKECLLFDKAV
jgi:hypothetical protein